jgi:hypothetical protein
MSEDDIVPDERLESKENSIRKTPRKSRLTSVECEEQVRRSPRKHPGSRNAGFSKLTITGSAIVPSQVCTQYPILFKLIL